MPAEIALYRLGILLLCGSSALTAVAQDRSVADTSKLRPSSLPGYAVAQQKCGICHSADYIELQPPNMTTPQWTAEALKMQHTYGAPIDDREIALLGEYLGVTYGGQAASGPADNSSGHVDTTSIVAPTDQQIGALDAKSLLDHNACLTCHSVDKKIVGPAYKDVAAKYRNDSQAIAHVQASIRSGGQGKWGDVPMPPFPALSDTELRVLAEFVLHQ
jgi:cytochrome c551/c552